MTRPVFYPRRDRQAPGSHDHGENGACRRFASCHGERLSDLSFLAPDADEYLTLDDVGWVADE